MQTYTVLIDARLQVEWAANITTVSTYTTHVSKSVYACITGGRHWLRVDCPPLFLAFAYIYTYDSNDTVGFKIFTVKQPVASPLWAKRTFLHSSSSEAIVFMIICLFDTVTSTVP